MVIDMKIGIIDDDKEFAEVLNKELEQLFSQVQIKKIPRDIR